MFSSRGDRRVDLVHPDYAPVPDLYLVLIFGLFFLLKKCKQFKVILQAIFSRAKVTGCVTTDQTRPTVLKLIKKLKSNGYIRKFSPPALGLEANPLENPGYAPACRQLLQFKLKNHHRPKKKQHYIFSAPDVRVLRRGAPGPTPGGPRASGNR